MKLKKTVSFEKLVEKANFDLLVDTYVGNDSDVALTKFSVVKNILLSFDGYAGYGHFRETSTVEKMLKRYNSKNKMYSDEEIQKVIDAHVVSLNRIADMWYNETGNALPDVIDDGRVKDVDRYSEWLQYSANHFEDDNWIFLY
jgi:hypothetical protein